MSLVGLLPTNEILERTLGEINQQIVCRRRQMELQ